MSVKWLRLFPWAPLALIAAGCGGRAGPPAPADPAAARSALRTVLDAWKKGEAADSLKDRRPPMYVIDYEWRSGHRLLGYEVQDDGPFGGDLRCRVMLSLADEHGRSVSKSVVYAVGTNPAVTVTREEDP
jgi:hypothetical protein